MTPYRPSALPRARPVARSFAMPPVVSRGRSIARSLGLSLGVSLGLAMATAACGGRSGPAPTVGMVDSRVMLDGDPAFADADAIAMASRIQTLGYTGEARAIDGRIELRLPMPAGVAPDRIVARVIQPGQLKIHAEVAANANTLTLQDCTGGQTDCHPVAVGPALLTSADVAEAAMMPDLAGGGLAVRVRFTDAGAKRLEQATTHQVGQRLVIQVDDVVLSRPVVHEPIVGGEAVIHIGPALHELQLGHASTLVARIQGPPLQADWTVATTESLRPRR